jgi:hypothetical protein
LNVLLKSIDLLIEDELLFLNTGISKNKGGFGFLCWLFVFLCFKFEFDDVSIVLLKKIEFCISLFPFVRERLNGLLFLLLIIFIVVMEKIIFD